MENSCPLLDSNSLQSRCENNESDLIVYIYLKDKYVNKYIHMVEYVFKLCIVFDRVFQKTIQPLHHFAYEDFRYFLIISKIEYTT